MAEISEKLKMARKAAGMRQEDAATSMGMLRVTLSSIESGKRKVSTDELVKFSKLYNVDPNFLLEYDYDNTDFFRRINSYYQLISLQQKFSELLEDDKQEILDIINLKLKKKRGEDNNNRT